MSEKIQERIQHPPLRVPQGWNTEDRRFVIQLEGILEDLYRQVRLLQKRVTAIEESEET